MARMNIYAYVFACGALPLAWQEPKPLVVRTSDKITLGRPDSFTVSRIVHNVSCYNKVCLVESIPVDFFVTRWETGRQFPANLPIRVIRCVRAVASLAVHVCHTNSNSELAVPLALPEARTMFGMVNCYNSQGAGHRTRPCKLWTTTRT